MPGKFVLDPSVTHDYALLKLKKKIEAKDFIPLNGDTPQLKNDKKLSIYGYPGDSYEPTNK